MSVMGMSENICHCLTVSQQQYKAWVVMFVTVTLSVGLQTKVA
jgi:hypothetical protein